MVHVSGNELYARELELRRYGYSTDDIEVYKHLDRAEYLKIVYKHRLEEKEIREEADRAVKRKYKQKFNAISDFISLNIDTNDDSKKSKKSLSKWRKKTFNTSNLNYKDSPKASLHCSLPKNLLDEFRNIVKHKNDSQSRLVRDFIELYVFLHK